MRREEDLHGVVSRPNYPSWGDLLVLLGVFIVATVVGSLLVSILQKIGSVSQGFGIFLGYLFQFSVTIGFGLYQRKTHSPQGTPSLKMGIKKLDFTIILLGTIVVLATGIVIEPLLETFPNKYIDQLSAQMGAGGWMMVTSIVVAPVMEETLFRGIVQHSLTRKYGAWRGLLIASAVFGIVHFNPQQVVNAFMVGLILGYIYYRTEALLPVILIHCINNAISYFSWVLGGERIVFTRELFGNDAVYQIVYVTSCVLVLVCFVSIGLRIGRERKRTELAGTSPISESGSGMEGEKSDKTHTNHSE